MNWNKFKTIVIIAFILINIFLLTKYLNVFKKTEYLNNAQVNTAINILKQNNIELKCGIPKEIHWVSNLNVLVETEYSDQIKRLFGNRVDRYKKEYVSGVYHIKVDGSKLFLSSVYSQDPFELLGIDKSIYIKDYFENKYLQVYNGYTIFDGILEVYEKNGQMEIMFVKINPQSFEKRKKRGLSSLEAIFSLLNQQKGISEINSIMFGYYQKDYNVLKGQAIPVWRIIVNKDTTYYINAFTGSLE